MHVDAIYCRWSVESYSAKPAAHPSKKSDEAEIATSWSKDELDPYSQPETTYMMTNERPQALNMQLFFITWVSHPGQVCKNMYIKAIETRTRSLQRQRSTNNYA